MYDCEVRERGPGCLTRTGNSSVSHVSSRTSWIPDAVIPDGVFACADPAFAERISHSPARRQPVPRVRAARRLQRLTRFEAGATCRCRDATASRRARRSSAAPSYGAVSGAAGSWAAALLREANYDCIQLFESQKQNLNVLILGLRIDRLLSSDCLMRHLATTFPELVNCGQPCLV